MHRSDNDGRIQDKNKVKKVITRPDHLNPTLGTSRGIAPAFSPDNDEFPDVIHEDAQGILRENENRVEVEGEEEEEEVEVEVEDQYDWKQATVNAILLQTSQRNATMEQCKGTWIQTSIGVCR